MNDETTQPRKPRRPAARKPTPPVETPATTVPVPDAFHRAARRGDAITGRVRASFRALRLLDHADPEVVLAVGDIMLKRYASEPAMRAFVADLWRTAQCWAEEWTASDSR